MSFSQEVVQFLKQNKDFVSDPLSGRIKCVSTGHEMPARIDVLTQYANGKAYKMKKENYIQDFSKYEPYIVPSQHEEKKLYCKVTKMLLNKIVSEVEAHVKGKRYQKKLVEFQSRLDKSAKKPAKEQDADEAETDEALAFFEKGGFDSDADEPNEVDDDDEERPKNAKPGDKMDMDDDEEDDEDEMDEDEQVAGSGSGSESDEDFLLKGDKYERQMKLAAISVRDDEDDDAVEQDDEEMADSEEEEEEPTKKRKRGSFEKSPSNFVAKKNKKVPTQSKPSAKPQQKQAPAPKSAKHPGKKNSK